MKKRSNPRLRRTTVSKTKSILTDKQAQKVERVGDFMRLLTEGPQEAVLLSAMLFAQLSIVHVRKEATSEELRSDMMTLVESIFDSMLEEKAKMMKEGFWPK